MTAIFHTRHADASHRLAAAENFFYQNSGNEGIEVACIAARQARFEHGQRGAPSQWLRA